MQEYQQLVTSIRGVIVSQGIVDLDQAYEDADRYARACEEANRRLDEMFGRERKNFGKDTEPMAYMLVMWPPPGISNRAATGSGCM